MTHILSVSDSLPPLAVDLDGTLLRSDMLYESFWSAFSRDWRTPFRALASLSRGRAALKATLADLAEVDVATLPFDPEVVEYVKDWRARGGTTALITASDQSIATEIAAHLDIFDEVHGSTDHCNLKGTQKGAFLNDRFGAGKYAYMGDAVVDLAIWKDAVQAVTVNATPALQSKVAALVPEATHLTTRTRTIKPYIKSVRPHQWLKNALVFLPMLAAHNFAGATFVDSVMAFVAFSVTASSIYLVNDLVDLKADRNHPRKRLRPFAAGTVPIVHGMVMLAVLILVGLVLALSLGPAFAGVIGLYYIITTAYSLTLKRRVIIDIYTLAGLYTLRVIAGGAATGIPLSTWLLAFSVFFFFALAAVKRQAELVDGVERGKITASGRSYHVEDLPIVSTMAIASGFVSVLVMALYINSPEVQSLYNSPMILGGVCAVLLYWLSRIVLLTHRGHMHDDPLVFAVRDRNSFVCLMLMLAFVVLGALA